MEKIGELNIRIQDFNENNKISPDIYDIKELESILKLVQDLLYPENKERPLIAYNIEDGSVKHIFKTGIQAIIAINAIIGEVRNENSIDFLDLKTAKAFESIQNLSYKRDYKIDISTSLKNSSVIEISPKSRYLRSDDVMVESEFYFYGTLIDAGGKKKPNIHLDVAELGMLTISIEKDILTAETNNLLYKKYGVRAKGKQNPFTGEIEKGSLTFIEFLDYSPMYDEDYLNKLIQKASKNWQGIDVDKWLEDVRGEYA
jgi:hypothetical protein